MKEYSGINYGQRPESYWADQDVLTSLLRNVKGTERRKMIAAYWTEGRLEELSEELLQDALSQQVREDLGRIHPAFLGGEYLPNYATGETEIARIELRSVTADVISIRARLSGKRIRYRIVDEYETKFLLQRQSSGRPLSLKELVRFINGSGHPDLPGDVALCYNEYNTTANERAHLRHFTRISSVFYPQLEEHYEQVFEEWVRETEEIGDQPNVEKTVGGPAQPLEGRAHE